MWRSGGFSMRVRLKGYCWVVGKCNWWNPPVELMLDSLGKINFCMECWRFEE